MKPISHIFSDGSKYVGNWKNGKEHGHGTSTYPDGRKYVGEYKDGDPNGQGTFTYPDGEKYEGEWKDGKPNGQGTRTFTNGYKYVGEFKDGEYHGQGTYTNPDGSKYVGDYKGARDLARLDNLEQFVSEWIDKIDVKIEQPFIKDQDLQHCPYAKAAWKNEKIKIVKVSEFTLDNFWGTVTKELDAFGKDKDIVIVGAITNIHIIDKDQLAGACDAINIMLAEKKQDTWLLNGFGEYYTLLLMQRTTDLDNASIALEKKGYYEGLNTDKFNKNILHRRKLREKLN
ncbi:uncharacterized protein METZ01_LOCUS176304 [marine metagenome]|uniref:MORN repeat-containing protein n=1 Tax=marine metagenome TaxID=408172 RepID=A0A382CBQ4_9ZZZZ